MSLTNFIDLHWSLMMLMNFIDLRWSSPTWEANLLRAALIFSARAWAQMQELPGVRTAQLHRWTGDPRGERGETLGNSQEFTVFTFGGWIHDLTRIYSISNDSVHHVHHSSFRLLSYADIILRAHGLLVTWAIGVHGCQVPTFPMATRPWYIASIALPHHEVCY